MDAPGVVAIDEVLEQPSRLRLVVTGTLDGPGGDLLAGRVADALLVDIRLVVVDVGGVDTLDRDGLKSLVSLRAWTTAAGVSYEIANAPPLLEHLLTLTLAAEATEPWERPATRA